MGSGGRIGLGGLFVAVGVASWLGAWSWLAPPRVGEPPAAGGGIPGWLFEQIGSVSARWAAVAVGIGGLVLAARAWRRGVGLAVGLGLLWLGADALLDLSDVGTGTAIVATAAVVVVAALVLLAAAWRRGAGSGPAWSLLIYSGVLLALRSGPYAYVELDDTAGLWPPLVLSTTAFVLAAVLALVSGAWPPSQARAWGVLLGVLVLAGLTAVTATSGAYYLLALLVVWPAVLAPVLLAILVSLTGRLPARGRGALAFAGLVVGGIAIGAPIAVGALSPGWPGYFGVEFLGLPAAWLLAAAVAVCGVLLGVVMVVAVAALRGAADPARPASRRPTGASVAGVLFAIAGTASWVLMAVDLQPRMAALVAQWCDQRLPRCGLDSANGFAGLGWDLRWAAIVLAAAGLWLLARGRARRRALAAGIVAWFAVDLLLVGTSLVPGSAADWVVVTVAGVALIAVVLLAARRDHVAPPSLDHGHVYSGALVGVGLLLFDGMRPWTADHVSLVLPTILAALLVLAGVATALVAGPEPVGAGRAFAAALVAALGVAAVLALGWWRQTSDVAEPTWGLVSALVLGGLILACGRVAGVVPSLRAGWRLPGTAGLVAVAAPAVLVGAGMAAFLATILGQAALGTLLDLTGPFLLDEGAQPLTMFGAFAGLTFAAITLFPRALSTLDTAVPDPAPESTAPPARPAPVAVAGVPEVLEWPPRSLAARQ